MMKNCPYGSKQTNPSPTHTLLLIRSFYLLPIRRRSYLLFVVHSIKLSRYVFHLLFPTLIYLTSLSPTHSLYITFNHTLVLRYLHLLHHSLLLSFTRSLFITHSPLLTLYHSLNLSFLISHTPSFTHLLNLSIFLSCFLYHSLDLYHSLSFTHSLSITH
jgi:hypothetical protein